MSTGIAITRFWDDWESFSSGDGAISLTSDNLKSNCSAGAGSGRAYMRKYMPARPGERVKFSFLARRISGEPQASIDWPSTGQSKGVVDIDSDEFQEYSIEFLVPYTTDEASDYMQCTVGVFTTNAGDVDIVNPKIEVSDASQGFLRAWCAGIIRLSRAAGVTTASINGNFINCGIKSVAWDSPTKKLTVETLKSPNISIGVRPILSAEFTTDLLPSVFAKAGQYTPSTGEFDVQFSDGTSTFIDINNAMTDGQEAFLSVWAMGL